MIQVLTSSVLLFLRIIGSLGAGCLGSRPSREAKLSVVLIGIPRGVGFRTAGMPFLVMSMEEISMSQNFVNSVKTPSITPGVVTF